VSDVPDSIFVQFETGLESFGPLTADDFSGPNLTIEGPIRSTRQGIFIPIVTRTGPVSVLSYAGNGTIPAFEVPVLLLASNQGPPA